ncbi:MAG TPA: YqeG family HAD IIIA-type phosphatase [Erysipelotrichaceae bacterium]|nr:YqeG family HAD IIIA-type phosphatase [Erysipelotrichaceae bacterium]
MCKKFIPYAHAQSVYEISTDFYKTNNVRVLLIDLDNTLDSYRLYYPTDRAIKLIKDLKKEDIKPVVISNNCRKRVCGYAEALGVDCIYSARKPFSFKIKRFLNKNGIKNNETMLIGDQLITDVLAAKGANIRVVLTEKIVKEDQWTTHINRLLDRPIRYHLSKKGWLPDWRKKYGKK